MVVVWSGGGEFVVVYLVGFAWLDWTQLCFIALLLVSFSFGSLVLIWVLIYACASALDSTSASTSYFVIIARVHNNTIVQGRRGWDSTFQ